MEKVGTERRLEILEAAMTLFSKKGFERTTVDEIASCANVGKGTVYLYFDNKEEIFWAIIEKGLLELEELLTDIITRSQDFQQQFYNLIYANLSYVEDHLDFYRLFLKERLSVQLLRHEETSHLIREKHHRLHRRLAEFMQTGIDHGYLRPGNSEDYCIAVTGIITHFAAYWIMFDSSQPLTTKTDFILDLVLSGIKK